MKKFIIVFSTFALLMSSTVIYGKTKRTIEAIFGEVKIVVNGKLLNNETLLYDGTTYVPLRAVSEALGQKVQYDETTKTAYFSNEKPVITQKPNISTKPNTEDTSEMADQIFELVNKERNIIGLPSLSKNTILSDAANVRAVEIESLFSHDRPDGSSGFTVLSEFDIFTYSSAGENIAFGQTSATQVMSGWMNSPGHKSNILSSGFDTIGIGCYKSSSGQIYWVQLFMGTK